MNYHWNWGIFFETSLTIEGVRAVIDAGQARIANYDARRGINTLTGADSIAPYGGAAFHDNKVWIKPRAAS